MDNLTLIEKMIPYLRILKEGRLAKNNTNQAVIENLVSLRWAIQARQKSFVEITDKGVKFIPDYLSNHWDGWEEYCARLIEAGLDLNFEAAKELERQERFAVVNLPKVIHHKTLAAIMGVHSKTGISKGLERILTGTTITTDQSLRIQANQGMTIATANGEILDCDSLMDSLGEVAIPERAFLKGMKVGGTLPRAIFTIENRGSFVDFPASHKDVLVIHTPGNDLDLAKRLLSLLPSNVTCFHFGDLDPKGLDIFRNLSDNCAQDIYLFVPSFWAEYYSKTFSRPKDWPVDSLWGEITPLVKTLIDDKRWLEQEKIAIDNRLAEEIKEAIAMTVTPNYFHLRP